MGSGHGVSPTRRCDTPGVSLISVAELAAALDDPDLRIADVRWSLAAPGGGRAAYATAHLPGAVFVDLESVLTAPVGPGRHPLPDPAAFAAALGALGIGRRQRVVTYDDAGGTVAARLWWMLDALGHARAAVLDGGIGAWRAAGLPVTAEVPVHAALPPEERLASAGVGSAWPRTIDRVALAARLGEVTLLDARALERYRGEIEPVDRVPGHIPTARSLPTSALLDAGGQFLAPAALASRFAAAGVGGGGAVRVGGAPRAGVGGAVGGAPRAGVGGAGAGVQVGGSAEVGAGSVGAGLGSVGAGSAEVGAGSAVVACGSGVNACQLALAMRASGLPDPLLYPGSYSDWTQWGMPIATGDEPGEPPVFARATSAPPVSHEQPGHHRVTGR
jgi:thiosulfate/3-mercaptopyruvate sulfurtransferase